MVKKVAFIIVLVALAGFLVYQYAFIPIPVAAGPLTAGHVMTEADIATQRVLFNNVPEIIERDPALLVGKVVAMDVEEGGLLMPFLFQPPPGTPNPNQVVLDVDYALVPLVVNAANIPASLSFGDSVQIIVRFAEGMATLQPAFVHGFPYLAKIHAVREDAAGLIVGVDVIVRLSIANELAMASLEGTIVLVIVNPETAPVTGGTNANQMYTEFFSTTVVE